MGFRVSHFPSICWTEPGWVRISVSAQTGMCCPFHTSPGKTVIIATYYYVLVMLASMLTHVHSLGIFIIYATLYDLIVCRYIYIILDSSNDSVIFCLFTHRSILISVYNCFTLISLLFLMGLIIYMLLDRPKSLILAA